MVLSKSRLRGDGGGGGGEEGGGWGWGGGGRETCVQDISLIAPFSKDFSSRLFTNQILSNFVNTLAENYTINKYIHKTYEVTRIVCTFDCYLHDIALEKSRK